MVRELVGLKVRLFWNGLRSDRQRQVGLPLILALVVWLAWRTSSAHAATMAGLGPGSLPHYLAWAALVVFIAWVALPVVIFPIDENLDPDQLTTFPISRPRLVTGLAAAALFSPPIIVVLTLVTTTLAAEPASLLVSLPAGVLFVLILVVGSQAFTTLISAVLHSRRGRDLAVFLVMGIGLSTFAGYQALRGSVSDLGIAAAVSSNPLDAVWWAVPPAAPAHAVSAAWAGDWVGVGLGLVVSAAWVVVLAAVWERLLRWLLVTPRQEAGGSGVLRRNGMAAGRWEVPFMVARKELRFYVRDPRQRLVWTGTVIFVGLAVAAIVVGSTGFAQFRTREWLPALAPVLVLMVGLPVALNQFGWERNAASYLFALPAQPRSIILGKNLAACLGLMVETVFLGVLFAWFSNGWVWLPLVIPLAIGAILCLLAVGNIVSIITPLRLPREGTDVFAQSTEQGLLALVSQVVAFFVIGLLLVIPASATVLTVSFGQVIAPWVTSLLSITWGLFWYGLSLLLAGRLLRRRVPEVVGWVQVV